MKVHSAALSPWGEDAAPGRWHVDEAQECSFVRYQTTGEILGVLRRLADDPSGVPARRRIHDLRGIRKEPGTEEVLDLARSAVSLWRAAEDGAPGGSVAVLAGGDLAFGLARMFESYAEGMVEGQAIVSPRLRIVRSFGSAAEWVGLPAGYRDPFAAADHGVD